jgi:hypothetical protein
MRSLRGLATVITYPHARPAHFDDPSVCHLHETPAPGGVRAVTAQSLLLKRQILIGNRLRLPGPRFELSHDLAELEAVRLTTIILAPALASASAQACSVR